MKTLVFAIFLSLSGLAAAAQGTTTTAKPTESTPAKVVEASCGQCNFGLKEPGCELAVRIDGKAYFVDGSDIDQHGDSHAKDGFCNAIRKATVQGSVVDNRFKATSFQLLPEEPKKKN
ncbi:DUF6370 family protein [Rufibacter sp. LB8]|uniref:DUF6370 family protein n=1 Tax=Rufibacter sp. LB8 TaxID=2777781 RepID=UPI00178C32BC|nr:DUF6370 family protein [Rufibacter sp. LB8]